MVRGPVQSLATARGTGEAACPGLSSSSCPYLALILSPPPILGCSTSQPVLPIHLNPTFSISTPDPPILPCFSPPPPP